MQKYRVMSSDHFSDKPVHLFGASDNLQNAYDILFNLVHVKDHGYYVLEGDKIIFAIRGQRLVN